MRPEFLKEILYYDKLSPPLLMLVFGVAFLLGAIHALGPGHGKSLMAAYLVGATNRVRDAVLLAITITISHVFSVIVIGFIALWLTDFFLPERINKWLALFSGLSIIAIGVWLLMIRLKKLRQKGEKHTHHYQKLPQNLSIWSSITLGISTGIVPCPRAIVILLLAISVQKIVLGITIILVFSLGIAVVLILLGIILVKASYLIKDKFEDRTIQLIPLIGAIIIITLGVIVFIKMINI